MKDEKIPIIVGGWACLIVFAALLGGCTWGVLKDGDGKIKGVGPVVVPVEESPKAWTEIALDSVNTPEGYAILSAIGLPGIALGARALRKGAAKRERHLFEEKIASHNAGLEKRRRIEEGSA